MPLLAAIFIVHRHDYGAQLVGVTIMAWTAAHSGPHMQGAVKIEDVNEGLVKSLVFGLVCSLLAVFQGYR